MAREGVAIDRFSIDVDEDAGMVRATVRADTDETLALELLAGAATAAEERALRLFLVDLRGTRDVAPEFADYELAYRLLGDSGLPAGSRIALLVDAGDRTREFFALAATNAGYLVTVVTDAASAVAWLQR